MVVVERVVVVVVGGCVVVVVDVVLVLVVEVVTPGLRQIEGFPQGLCRDGGAACSGVDRSSSSWQTANCSSFHVPSSVCVFRP